MSTPKLGKKYQMDCVKLETFADTADYEYANYDDGYYDTQEYNIQVCYLVP